MKTSRSSTAHALLWAMSVVVVSFLAGVGYLARSSSIVGRETTTIVTNAKPSTDQLVAALAELRKIDASMDRNLESMMGGGPVDTSDASAALKALDRYLAGYLALPAYPGEKELQTSLGDARNDLGTAYERMLKIFQEKDPAAAHQFENGSWRAASDRLDGAMHRLIVFNLAHLQVHTDRLEETWRHALIAALVVGLFNLLLALLAGRLAIQATRAREKFLEVRASELEMFAGRVAHDLMSPLASVGLALQTAEKRSSDGQVVRLAGRALSSMRRLRDILNALLSFARAGGQPSPGRAAVLPIAAAQIDELQSQAETEQISLTSSAVPESEVNVPPGILMVLLSNLLRNALTHMGDSKERQVQLRVLDRPGCIRFEVWDTGPGVPPDQRERVFEAFVQGPASTGGIGLGLATVKRLAEAHGGRVGINPRPGGGSIFWFELPGNAVAPEAARAVEPAAKAHA
jgi:signal transduction histidine kinase